MKEGSVEFLLWLPMVGPSTGLFFVGRLDRVLHIKSCCGKPISMVSTGNRNEVGTILDQILLR